MAGDSCPALVEEADVEGACVQGAGVKGAAEEAADKAGDTGVTCAWLVIGDADLHAVGVGRAELGPRQDGA